MFRQKIAEVTDCSCRLLSDGKNEYMIFKNQNTDNKPFIKEAKQKYSLKTQTNSSNKHDTKVNSANKTSLKVKKGGYQDQKISITENIDSKKKKMNGNSLCSPSNSNIKSALNNGGIQINSQKNNIKIAQADTGKQQRRLLRNSHYQSAIQNHLTEQDSIVRNFVNTNVKYNLSNQTRINEQNKRNIKFQNYYKFVSNPYQNMFKNKDKLNNQTNQTQFSRTNQHIQKKIKKSVKIAPQGNVIYNQQSRQKVPIQIIHQSLQKFEKNKLKDSRDTYKGTNTTKYSQNGSIVNSQNQFSMISSKTKKNIQNSSISFYHAGLEFDLRKNKSNICNLKPNQTSQGILSNPKQHKTTQNSQIWKYKSLNECSINFRGNQSAIVQCKKNVHLQKKQKTLIQKMNTFTQLMSNKAECESLMDQSQDRDNENDQSIVLLRHQDLLQLRETNEGNQNFVLKPLNLQLIKNTTNKLYSLTNSVKPKFQTNVKKYTKKQTIIGNENEYQISCSNNLKKTVKVNRQYLTKNFNLNQ